MPLWTRLIALFAALALGVALAGCGGGDDDENGSGDVPADAIALVEDRSIPKSEYDRLLTQAQATYEAREQDFPAAGTPEFAQLRNAIVRSLVEQAQFEIAAGGAHIDRRGAGEAPRRAQATVRGDDAKYRGAESRA
jgi:hypothetical protein